MLGPVQCSVFLCEICQYTHIKHYDLQNYKTYFFLFKKKQNLLQPVAVVCVLSPFSGEVRSKEHRGLGHGGADVQMAIWVEVMALGRE